MELFTSLLDEALESWQDARQGLIREVQNLSPDQLDFRLSPETRAVAEVVRHVIEISLMMAGELCRADTDFQRTPFPKLIEMYAAHVKKAAGKRQLLDLLKSSHKECDRRFREVGEIFMLQLIMRFDGRKGTRLAWLHHGIGHEMYHTGQLTAFARALGRIPALTQMIEGGE
jgi:uncharacterized damage-inducible protein DinB